MELGEYVSKYRKQAGMTIDELASISGVPKGTINKIISGTTKSPTLDSVIALSNALGKTINDFIDDAPKKNSLPPEDEKLLGLFHQLNDEGQDKVTGYTTDLVDTGKYKKARSAEQAG